MRIGRWSEPRFGCQLVDVLLHPLSLITVVLLVWVPDSGAILHERANKIKVSRLLKHLSVALQVAT